MVVLALLLALLCAAAALWYMVLPEWRPGLKAGESYGIDVASHQGDIDWGAVRADGIGFSYIKATEGGDFRDERFEQNLRGASDAGLRVGAYHFFTLCTEGSAQAANFLEVAPASPHLLTPAVDLELAGNCSARPPEEEVREELGAFLRRVESAWGSPALLYIGDDFANAYPGADDGDRPTWVRRFLLRPDGDRWRVWQLHGYAHVDGITGKVDLDVMRDEP
jgi:lysozyme